MDLRWIRSSDYGIKTPDERFWIAKLNGDEPMYCLWEGRHIIGCFETPQQAKDKAGELA